MFSLHPSKGIDSPYITYFSSSQCHYLWGPFRTTTSYHREHRLLPCTQICLQHIRVYLFQHDSGACLPKHVCSYSSEQVQLLTWPCHHYFFSLHPFHFLYFQLALPMWELLRSYEQLQDSQCLSNRDIGLFLEWFSLIYPYLLAFGLHGCQS